MPAEPRTLPAQASGTEPGRAVRRRLPLWAHVAALAAVLLVGLWVIGPGRVFIDDEGLYLAQAKLLAAGDGWYVENPFPAADPLGRASVFNSATNTVKGTAPYSRHPVYPLVLAAADRVAGKRGMFLLSIVGGLACAVAAARLARRLDPVLEVPTLWAAGLGSPLFFDSYLVIAHTLAAAFAGFAALAVLRHRASARPRELLLIAVLLVPVGALRSEGLLFGAALAAAIVLLGLRAARQAGRRIGWGELSAAGAALAGTAGGYVLDAAIRATIDATVISSTAASPPTHGWILDRLQAFSLNFYDYGYENAPHALVPIAVALVTLLGVRRLGRGRVIDEVVRRWAVAICAVSAAWVAFSAGSVVPGLLLACPLLVAAAAAARRSLWRSPSVLLLATTSAVYAAFVVATEYSIAGDLEWGARYLALCLPLVVPIAVAALWRLGERLPADSRIWASAAAVALVVAPAVVSLRVLRVGHHRTAAAVTAVAAAAATTPPGDGGRPVVVSTVDFFGRLAWDHVPPGRWLEPHGTDLPLVVRRLEASHITAFVVLAFRDRPLPLLASYRLTACRPVRPLSDNYQTCIARL